MTDGVAGCSTGRRPGRHAPAMPTGLWPLPVRSRRRASSRPHLLPIPPRSPRPHSAADRSELDGEAGFAELFFDDVFVPDTDVLGAPGDGWRVAMSTTGNERGLSLRSPGRFLATADRLWQLWDASGRPAEAEAAVVDGWLRARAYQLYTWGARSPAWWTGGDMGAAGSGPNKCSGPKLHRPSRGRTRPSWRRRRGHRSLARPATSAAPA